MEILLLLVIAILVYIAYKLSKLNLGSQISKPMPTSTSLNPLFSEEEIASQRDLSRIWQEKVELYFDLLQRMEKVEIEEHHKSGKSKSEFKPSAKLRDVILQQSIAITGRNMTEATAQRMIEENISILNGRSIAEASKQFQKEHGQIPWENTDLDADAWRNEPEIKKAFEEDLQARIVFWSDSWNHVLEKDYLDKKH